MECIYNDYESICHDLIESIVFALDAKDTYTAKHSIRVGDMACQVCEFLNLSNEEREIIHIAGHVHDIGKIGIPDKILNFLDLDNFKTINDYLGHMSGDEVLKDTAQKINSIFNQENDINSRFGGDEFCIFEENSSILMVKEKIKKLSKLLEKNHVGKNHEPIRISASIGIASYPYNGMSLKELIEKADRALYKSKENGKNQITIYNDNIRKIYKFN